MEGFYTESKTKNYIKNWLWAAVLGYLRTFCSYANISIPSKG